MPTYPTYPTLDLPALTAQVRTAWQVHDTFQQSLRRRQGAPPCHFYEGPPSANGKPGIHHVMARTLKDLFCRYKTMQGYYVPRRTGWDAHGLPVELQVEKELGITKEAIGSTITMAAYNRHCRATVQRYQAQWEAMTDLLGYWADSANPYNTCDNTYVANVWAVIKCLYDKGFLYQGYAIQPYSPAAGTGLSNHELNQPGCYRDVKSTTLTAQFQLLEKANTYLLAWTTTPWTLPANTALAVGKHLSYLCVRTHHPYTQQVVDLLLAEERLHHYFDPALEGKPLKPTSTPGKVGPWHVVARYRGADLVGCRYAQLMPYVQPSGDAFRVVHAAFVTTSEGTGIVHIAPTFGSDDYLLAQQEDLPSITVPDPKGAPMPIVDAQGCYVEAITDYAGEHVKAAYAPEEVTQAPGYRSVDRRIAQQLTHAGKAFAVATHTHTYPHCWRTDKPILYYPLRAWFLKTTACKERLLALNKTIQWQPPATGQGRFGNWLENLVDWNLSRTRFWGTPLPLWRTQEGDQTRCIGSLQELQEAVQEAIEAGFMQAPLPDDADLHRPYVDAIVLCSTQGKPMYRVPEVADVWLDSGAMPYAQHPTPVDLTTPPVDFPATFIAEGVDQTRGWFFTLHALAVMLFDTIAYRHVLATGLVLDKEGQKMSKRLGNTLDPTALLQAHGSDVVRWYMVAHAYPWENLRFDPAALQEVMRRFFGTLYNTYQFFARYATLDAYTPPTGYPPLEGCTQSDRWILARLQTLIATVTKAYDAYQPTQVARALQDFVIGDLSNWYVRANRKRFWHAGQATDKATAYHTLHACLTTVARLAAPLAPFYMEQLYGDLHPGQPYHSVHWSDFPTVVPAYQDQVLEQRMQDAQTLCSLVHALRKQHRLKVRQPLPRLLLPATGRTSAYHLADLQELIMREVNVKHIEHLPTTDDLVIRRARPHLGRLGRRYGKRVPALTAALAKLDQPTLREAVTTGTLTLSLPDGAVTLTLDDLLLTTEAIPGWATATEGELTVAVDLTLTPALLAEGLAREAVNRLQHLRKACGLAVEDRIHLALYTPDAVLREALQAHQPYLTTEVQATHLAWHATPPATGHTLEVPPHTLMVALTKDEAWNVQKK